MSAVVIPTVLITGASSGIGLAATHLFIEKGWNVVVTTRSAGPSPIPAKAHVFIADLTNEKTIQRIVRQIGDRFGRIDVLLNNAGYALGGPVEGMRPEQIEKQFATNVLAPLHMIRHVVPIMRKQAAGTIINISSIGGRLAFPYLAAYHGTKFAIEGISESLRFELRPFGIKVKLIEPGGISTNFLRAMEWASHAAYEPSLSELVTLGERMAQHLPPAHAVAISIYGAATDGSDKLRYLVKAGPWIALRAVLGDRLWFRTLNLIIARVGRIARRRSD
jgi:NAD(P)-dependent dehydrogenase (short-subunit alcohol dehydrogenase family)